MKIRIKFTKHGAMKFVGHLDILRYFQKAMRRADINMKYSEGFSPHQIMSFAAPLGVGLTSNGEYMDIEVQDTGDSMSMVFKLNETMADGIRVISYRKLEDSAKNAMSIVAAADYTLTFREASRPADVSVFMAEFMEFAGSDSIHIVKKTKKSEKEMDIKPMMFDVRTENETIFMKLATGSVENIKPELVMEAFYHSKSLKMPSYAFQIQREETYTHKGEPENHEFMSLEELGEEIE